MGLKQQGSEIKIFGILGLILCLLFSYFFSQKAYQYQRQTIHLKALKEDHAQINHIRYGVFNMGRWKQEVSQILSEQIDMFEISPQARRQIRDYILKYLHDFYSREIKSGKFLDEMLDQYAATSGKKKEFSLFGFKVNLNIQDVIKKEVKTQLANIDIDATMSGIADQMMLELKRNEPVIRQAIRDQMANYLQDKSQTGDLGIHTGLLEKKYNCPDLDGCNQKIQEQISSLEKNETQEKKILILMALSSLIFLLLLAMIPKRYQMVKWVIVPGLTILSLILLAMGLTMPMIDLYAGLQDVNIEILNRKIDFGEQVIFFQSKSILEVVDILMDSRQWDARIVGYLILVFSILFPLIKTIATFLMAYFNKLADNKIVSKMALTLSKWSMADVFVVGLFMAFIGFNTVIQSQLISLKNPSDSFDIITQNKTILRPGAIFFTGFVIVSLCLSTLLSWRLKTNKSL